jgi:fatty acid desaturase
MREAQERQSGLAKFLNGVVVLTEAVLFIAAIAFVLLACWVWSPVFWGPQWLLLMFAVVAAFFGSAFDLVRRLQKSNQTTAHIKLGH